MKQETNDTLTGDKIEKLKANVKSYRELSKEALLIERNRLVLELQGVEIKLSEARFGKDDEQKRLFANLKMSIQNKLGAINAVQKERNKTPSDYEAAMRAVIKETFGNDFLGLFMKEVGNRVNGVPPVKIKPPMQEKKVSIDLSGKYLKAIDMLINAKKEVSGWINDNEPEVNKGEYYSSVKRLSFCLPTLSELEKMKRF